MIETKEEARYYGDILCFYEDGEPIGNIKFDEGRMGGAELRYTSTWGDFKRVYFVGATRQSVNDRLGFIIGKYLRDRR